MKRRIHSVKHQPRKPKLKKKGGNPKLLRRFSHAAINQIRYDYEHLKMSLGAVGRKYLTTASHIYKIISRKIYKDVS